MPNIFEQTIHVKTPISREDFDSVIVGLEVACGGIRIEVEESFDLVVKDVRQVSALKSLFGTNSITEESIVKCNPSKSKHKFSFASVPHHQYRSWRVLDILGQVVEQITIEEKNRRLTVGDFEPDTILYHSRAGRQRVTGPKGQLQGLEPS